MKRTLLSLLVLASGGCGGGGDVRQESVIKLRALGVAANPVVAAWSADAAAPAEVELTINAALPLGTTATVVPFRDPRQKAALTYDEADITIDPASIKHTAVGGLTLFEAKAKVKVPTLAAAVAARALKPGSSGAALNYGFLITAGTEEERVVGNVLAYAAGSPELAWKAPTGEITEPAENAVLSPEEKGAIKAAIGNANGEELKVGWFTSGGEITNRRAKETTWLRPASGPQTLILTVRGKKSRGFSMKVIPITTQ